MSTPVSPLDRHIQTRNETLDKLVALASEGRKPDEAIEFHRKAEAERKYLESVQRSIDSERGENPGGKYVFAESAIKAIMMFLTDEGEPRSEEQIANGLLSGGFRGGYGHSRWRSIQTDIGRSIQINIIPTKKKKICYFGDLIGLEDWKTDTGKS